MTRSVRGLDRSENGSMVSRSVVKVCRRPVSSSTGPRAATRCSNARGQSSSVPSSSPTRCLTSPSTAPPRPGQSLHLDASAGRPVLSRTRPAGGTGRAPAATYDRHVVLVLAVSDEVDDALLADVHAVRQAQLIVACGDLPFEYLGELMNLLDVPLVFVPGNHDPDISGYRTSRAGLPLRAGLPARFPWPDGAISADQRVVDAAGLRLAGLGGCRRYREGPNQYTERQQARRARGLARRAGWRRARDGRGVDVLLTHAPPAGVGDGADPPHQGFHTLHRLTARLQPALLLHGHVHPHGMPPGDHRLGRTVVRNVVGRHLLEIEPGAGAQHSRDGCSHAR